MPNFKNKYLKIFLFENFIILLLKTYLLNYNTMENSILKFGKYKGQQFESTPKSYQEWLIKQDWFKAPKKTVDLWNVVVVFEREYAMATGRRSETLHYNLSFEDAKDLKEVENYNIYDGVDYYTVIQVQK